jgi:hypothetical protein
MRITRLVLAFFSVGFLAGSFERAAGLGDPQLAQRSLRAPVQHTAAIVTPPVLVRAGETKAAEEGTPSVRGEPVARAAAEEVAPPVALRAFVRPMQSEPDAAAAEATQALLDFSVSHPDLRVLAMGPARPMSLPSHAAWSPLPAPTFTPVRDGVLLPGVAAAQIADGLRPDREPAVAAAPEYILPIDHGRVTSMFNQGRYHPAIDLAAPLGTPVHATTRRQKVTFAGRRGGYGNLVVTRDPLGREHYYGHLSRIVAGIGALLEQGDLLGLLGSTGFSTGPHVHYEVRVRGRQLDPAGLLFAGQRVSRGYAWSSATPGAARMAARSDQPRPR